MAKILSISSIVVVLLFSVFVTWFIRNLQLSQQPSSSPEVIEQVIETSDEQLLEE